MSSAKPNISNADSPSAPKPGSQPSFRLIPSALLFTASCPVPTGIRARDMSAMVQGLVEEHAPLPIEQTSWGFILDNKTREKSHFLYYAAPRDLIFKSSAEANDLNLKSVIPSLVATAGLQFKRNTWFCLLEPECLSLIHFESGSSIPSQIHSQFFPSEHTAHSLSELRNALIDKYVSSSDEELIHGFIRIENTSPKGKNGIQFKLVQSDEAEGPWKAWQQTSLSQATRLVAADLRDKESLSGRLQRSKSGRRIGIIAAFVLLAIIVLGTFEYLQVKQQSEAQRLAELAEEQEPRVNRLKEVETMTNSLKSIFQKDFQPFQWLMVLNEARPDNLSISSYTLDESNTLTANGEATEVKALNLFIDTLESNPKFSSVTLANLNTDNAGVTFSIKIQTGDITAETPLAQEAISPNADDSNAEPPPELETTTEESSEATDDTTDPEASTETTEPAEAPKKEGPQS